MGGEIPGRDKKALEARLVRTSPYTLREMLLSAGTSKDQIMELRTERDLVDAVIRSVSEGKVVIPGLAEHVEPMKKEEAEMPKPKEAKGFDDDFDGDGATSAGSSDQDDLDNFNDDFDEEKPKEEEEGKEEEKPKRKAAKKEEKKEERKAETVGTLSTERVEVLLLKVIDTMTADHEKIVLILKRLDAIEAKVGLLDKILLQVFSAKRHVQYGLNRIFKIGDLTKLGNFKENVIAKAEEAAKADLEATLNPPKREAAT